MDFYDILFAQKMASSSWEPPLDWPLSKIQELVQAGKASKYFHIGDQLIVPWRDGNTVYQVPLDIVHFGDAELENGDTVPAMFLQWHYATPFGVQFDQNEAFYTVTDSLLAGTYYFTMGNSWGSDVVAGKSYQFTLTEAYSAGAQLQLGKQTSEEVALPDTAPENWRVRTYPSASTITPTEIVELTEGTEGTFLGTLSSSTKYAETGMNNMQRAGYGYNRWGQSGIRQYLNSAKVANAWWEAKNPYDRAPAQLATKAGFMAGFDEDFLSVLKPIKIVAALNTVSDSEIGTTETTYDTFFLPSKRNENLTEQLANVEGDVWDYWYRATNGVKPPDNVTGAAPITYAIENHTSAQYVRLRSAHRGNASATWYVYPSGYVNSGYATYALRFAPVCAIC